MSPIITVLLNTNRKPRYCVTNTQHHLSFLVIIWGVRWVYNVAITVSYQVIFHPHFVSIIHDNISSQDVNKRRHGFNKWMNSFIIHDISCPLIHQKCHPRSYHSDTTYFMRLNAIFGVVHERSN